MNQLQQAASFEEHVAAILNKFDSNYVWSDKDKSRLSIFMVDALAGISEVNQNYIVFAIREAFIRKARRSSSVLAGARFLGQTLNRRVGSSVTVTLRNNSVVPKTIAEFSQFNIGSQFFYNTESMNLAPNETKKLRLKQGTIRVKQFPLATVDLDFPEIILGIPGFNVSMEDLMVYSQHPAGGPVVNYAELDATIFQAKQNEAIYIHSTTDNGDVSLVFGNGRFGRRLDATHNLYVRYILTTGESGNISTAGVRVRFVDDDAITGATDEPSVGGSEPQDADTLKLYSPYVFESRGDLIRQKHWVGNIGNYPDVADVVVQSQRDIDPSDRELMNVVRVCILPKSTSSWGGGNPNPRSAQWLKWLDWVEAKKPAHITIQTYNPEKIPTDIVIEAYVFQDQQRGEWETKLNQAVADFFARKPGTLGRKLEPSDLDDLCKYEPGSTKVRREGLDYVRILSPDRPIEPRSQLEYVTPRSVSIVVKYSERAKV